MTQYRKKQVTIEAVRYDGTNYGTIKAFVGDACERTNNGVYIHTLEGDMKISIGDYVIKGVHGEFYPCKPDIFLETYEPV